MEGFFSWHYWERIKLVWGPGSRAVERGNERENPRGSHCNWPVNVQRAPGTNPYTWTFQMLNVLFNRSDIWVTMATPKDSVCHIFWKKSSIRFSTYVFLLDKLCCCLQHKTNEGNWKPGFRFHGGLFIDSNLIVLNQDSSFDGKHLKTYTKL